MARQKKNRLYTRVRGAEARYDGDFRDFADVGGKQEAWIAPEDKSAATDPVIAQKLLADRRVDLQALKRWNVLYGIDQITTLKEYAAHHLREKVRSRRVTDDWLINCERHLQEAVQYFEAGRSGYLYWESCGIGRRHLISVTATVTPADPVPNPG